MRRFCNLGKSRLGGGARRPAENGLLGIEACATSGRCIGCAGILGVGTPSYESMSLSGDGEECCLLATFSVPDLHASIYPGFEGQHFCRRLETAAPWPSALWHLSLAFGSLF